MTAPGLSPHVEACVRSAELARVVGEVLGRLPRAVGSVEGEHLAVPLVAVVDVQLPQVATLGHWTEPVTVADRGVQVAAVRPLVARDLAAAHDRRAAVKMATDPPAGCVWALYLDGARVAVLCLRPSVARSGVAGAA